MKPFAFALIFVLIGLPLHAASVVAEPFPPAHFTDINIGLDDGSTTTVIELSGNDVTYTKMVNGKVVDTAKVTPSADDWLTFIQGLNNAKVYKWAPQYEYPGQGGSWAVQLVMDDRSFTSTGLNDYPKDGAEDQPQADSKAGPSTAFKLFWQAVLVLVGKAPPPTASK